MSESARRSDTFNKHVLAHHSKNAASVGAQLSLWAVTTIGVVCLYRWQIASQNAYLGMRPWELSPALLIAWVSFLSLQSATPYWFGGRPSEAFVLIYSSVVLGSLAVLSPVSGLLVGDAYVIAIFVLAAPLLGILVGRTLVIGVPHLPAVPPHLIDIFLWAVVALTAVLAARAAPPSSALDLVSAYVRRLDAREVFPAGSPLAYLVAMSMNGFAPFLTFRAVMRRNYALVALGLLAAIFFFWLIGAKAPIAYALIAATVGWLFRRRGSRSLPTAVGLGLSAIAAASVLEYVVFSNSFIADIIIRRLFAVQAQLQGAYVDRIVHGQMPGWSLWSGSWLPGYSSTYFIGGAYFGNLELNANTSTFMYALAQGGILGWLLATGFVSAFYAVLDAFWTATRNPSFFFAGVMYALLLVEQAYGTALVSSGIGVLCVLAAIERSVEGTEATSTRVERPVKTLIMGTE